MGRRCFADKIHESGRKLYPECTDKVIWCVCFVCLFVFYNLSTLSALLKIKRHDTLFLGQSIASAVVRPPILFTGPSGSYRSSKNLQSLYHHNRNYSLFFLASLRVVLQPVAPPLRVAVLQPVFLHLQLFEKTLG